MNHNFSCFHAIYVRYDPCAAVDILLITFNPLNKKIFIMRHTLRCIHQTLSNHILFSSLGITYILFTLRKK